jgi:hypothetical protein
VLSYHLEEDHRSPPSPPEPSLEPELPRKIAFTISNRRPNCVTATGLSWTVSAADGEHHGDPLSPRSRRWRHCHVWCPVAWARSSPRRLPWRLPDALFHRCRQRKETTRSRRILSQQPRYLFIFIKIRSSVGESTTQDYSEFSTVKQFRNSKNSPGPVLLQKSPCSIFYL